MRISPFAAVTAVILVGGLAYVGADYFRQRDAGYRALIRQDDRQRLAGVGLSIQRTFDAPIIRLLREGGYCVPRCAMAYRAPWPFQKGNEHFFNSWEMVSDTAALRVLSFPELDADRRPQFRLLISYGTKREDGDLRTAEPKFADFVAKLMQRFEFPPALVQGECTPETATGDSIYRCKQNRFWWGDFAFDPREHPSVKTFKTERTITLIRQGPFGDNANG